MYSEVAEKVAFLRAGVEEDVWPVKRSIEELLDRLETLERMERTGAPKEKMDEVAASIPAALGVCRAKIDSFVSYLTDAADDAFAEVEAELRGEGLKPEDITSVVTPAKSKTGNVDPVD